MAKVKNDAEIAELQHRHRAHAQHFDDHQVIIDSFVDVYNIYASHSDLETGKLTTEGGQCFVASLRSTGEAKDLRDDEDGVEFFAGLRIDEMQLFGVRIPNTLWIIINNPLEVEYVYRDDEDGVEF